MARLGLDFRRKKTLSLLLLGGLLLASMAVALAFQKQQRLQQQHDVADAARVRLQKAVDRATDSKAPAATSAAALVEAARLSTALRMPWEKLLDDLQRTTSNEIMLQQVQPLSTGRLVVAGRADSSEAFMAFMQRLRKLSGWTVTPVSETYGMPDNTGKALAFQLAAEYRPHD